MQQAALSRRERQIVVNVVSWFCLRLSAYSARDFWGLVCAIDWVSLCVILPQIAQITQRNAAGLHYFAEKDRLVRLRWFCCLSARIYGISGIYWGFCVWIDWVLLRVILPQITQITQRNAASCIISQKRQFVVNVVLGFVCVNQRDLRETLGFHCAD